MFFSFIVHAQVRDWGDCVVDGVPTLNCLEIVFGNLLTMSTGLVVIILFLMLVIGSIRYLTSAADAEKLATAKNTMKYAFVGIFLFVGAFLILKIIDVLFLGGKGSLFQFKIPAFTNSTSPTASPATITSCAQFCAQTQGLPNGGVCALDLPGWRDPQDCPRTHRERGLPSNLQFICTNEPDEKCCCVK